MILTQKAIANTYCCELISDRLDSREREEPKHVVTGLKTRYFPTVVIINNN